MTSWQKLRDSFVTGLVLITPLLITLYILRVLVNFLLQFVDPVVKSTSLATYTANVEVIAQGIAAVLIVLAIALVGYLAQKPVGQRLFGSMGQVMSLVPLVRTIYGTIRQIMSTVSSQETSFDSLVLVEFPRKGLYSIGLVTGDSPREVEDVAGQPVYNVFLPSSPNPTGGRLILVPEDQVHSVDLSVREGMGLLVTTGTGGGDDAEALPNVVDAPLEGGTVRPADGNLSEHEHQKTSEREEEN